MNKLYSPLWTVRAFREATMTNLFDGDFHEFCASMGIMYAAMGHGVVFGRNEEEVDADGNSVDDAKGEEHLMISLSDDDDDDEETVKIGGTD